jgi:surfeit locus 1 family protein
VAPFYIEQEAPPAPGGLPRPGKLVVNLPDNHLQYALTWFALALVLVGVFAAFVLGQWRERRSGENGQGA